MNMYLEYRNIVFLHLEIIMWDSDVKRDLIKRNNNSVSGFVMIQSK